MRLQEKVLIRGDGIQFLDRVVDFPVACRLGTHSAHCTADRGVLTVTVLGMVVDSPVAV